MRCAPRHACLAAMAPRRDSSRPVVHAATSAAARVRVWTAGRRGGGRCPRGGPTRPRPDRTAVSLEPGRDLDGLWTLRLRRSRTTRPRLAAADSRSRPAPARRPPRPPALRPRAADPGVLRPLSPSLASRGPVRGRRATRSPEGQTGADRTGRRAARSRRSALPYTRTARPLVYFIGAHHGRCSTRSRRKEGVAAPRRARARRRRLSASLVASSPLDARGHAWTLARRALGSHN